jgi:FtsP/CotA-like multicopper oxidase with cupredoxin domain
MPKSQRFGFILLALAVIVVAGLMLKPKPSKTPAPQPQQAPREQTAAHPSGQSETAKQAPSTQAQQGQAPSAQTEMEKPVPVLVQGKHQTIKVKKGDEVHFRVYSKVAETIHVHGYDIERKIPANKAVDVRFKATTDGVYEIEFHGSDTEIAKLHVQP